MYYIKTIFKIIKYFSNLVNMRQIRNTLNGINSLTNNEQFYKYFISNTIFFLFYDRQLIIICTHTQIDFNKLLYNK